MNKINIDYKGQMENLQLCQECVLQIYPFSTLFLVDSGLACVQFIVSVGRIAFRNFNEVLQFLYPLFHISS